MSYATSHHTQQDYVCVMKGNHTNVSDFNTATHYNSRGVLKMVTLYFDDTDTVTFHFHSDNGIEDNLLGYYAEVVAVDADGNVAEIEQTFDNLELPNTFKPSEMANAINSIPSGGGDFTIPTFTKNCTSLFANGNWDWTIENFGNQMKTEDIRDAYGMFNKSKVSKIPFILNLTELNTCKTNYMFGECYNLTEMPVINGVTFNAENMFYECGLKEINFNYIKGVPYSDNLSVGTSMTQMVANCRSLNKITGKLSGSFYSPNRLFYNCYNLKEIPDDAFENAVFYQGGYWCGGQEIFYNCGALRSIPSSIFKWISSSTSANWNTGSSFIYYRTFMYCYVLDEVQGLSVLPQVTLDGQCFGDTFNRCHRLKEFTFQTQEDGSPITVNWSGQTIDLTKVGYVSNNSVYDIVNNYTDFTEDTRGIYNSGSAKPHEQYNTVKDHPDFWTTEVGYSRYNHDSAVNTINSLPDASTGTNNIIKLNRLGANYTNNGIDKLTEAEIAVAAAKGWTVSLV
jgi:hypothetical protein